MADPILKRDQNRSTRSASNQMDHGSLASIGATALQLTSTDIPAINGVLVKASNANAESSYIYVGNSDVTAGTAAAATDGFELGVGGSVMVEIDNANKIYVIGSTTGLAVSFILS